MKMQCSRIFSALAFTLLLGLAAQPARAQHHSGGGVQHYSAPKAQSHPPQQGAHGNNHAANGAANHPYQNQAGPPPNGFRPPNTFRPPPAGANGAQNTVHPPVNASGARPPGQAIAGQNENAARPGGTVAGSSAQSGSGVNSTK